MVVVVGKPKYPTPMMTAYIRFASLNPYWFVPPDLAAERIAPKVLKQGLKYLDDARLPGHVRLEARFARSSIRRRSTGRRSRDGKTEVFMRQLPGPHNSMGRMKFMFPNEAGVYLHDNPRTRAVHRGVAAVQRRLRAARGCAAAGPLAVRPRPRLGKRGHRADGAAATPVPVYITYLTAMPEPTARPSPFPMTSTAATRPSWRRCRAARERSQAPAASPESSAAAPVREISDVLRYRRGHLGRERAGSGHNGRSAGTRARRSTDRRSNGQSCSWRRLRRG